MKHHRYLKRIILKKDAKHKRLHTVRLNLYDIVEKTFIGAKIRSVVTRDWRWGRRVTRKWHKEIFGVIEIFCILIVVVIA